MTTVKRDSVWESIYAKHGDAKKADAIWNLRRRYSEIAEMRQRKSCKVISYIPPTNKGAAGLKGTVQVRCAATTLAGKPCPFRATCGKFCKKHVV